MTKQPFISVLIPTKNRPHLVGMAIQSVLEQTFGDFEVIVTDNDDSETDTRVAGGYKNKLKMKLLPPLLLNLLAAARGADQRYYGGYNNVLDVTRDREFSFSTDALEFE